MNKERAEKTRQQIAELSGKGRKPAEIAKDLGLSTSQVYYFRRKRNKPTAHFRSKRKKIEDAYERGGIEEVRKTAGNRGIAIDYARQILREKGVEFPRKNYTGNKLRSSRVVRVIALLIKNRDDGGRKTMEEIGGETNVTRQYVQQVADACRENGIGAYIGEKNNGKNK